MKRTWDLSDTVVQLLIPCRDAHKELLDPRIDQFLTISFIGQAHAMRLDSNELKACVDGTTYDVRKISSQSHLGTRENQRPPESLLTLFFE